MSKRVVLVVVFAAASTAAGPAAAQADAAEGPGARADFVMLDRNHDGYVSRVEALAEKEIAKRFAQFDTDRDGRLSPDEYARAKEDNDRRALRDAVITARVKAALLAEKGIPSLAISVDTYEGKVQLTGFVPSPDLASRAGRVTATVSGVRTVDNNIAVKNKGSS